jgi:glutamine phosphoribosylpyrophosphate amidotransferase
MKGFQKMAQTKIKNQVEVVAEATKKERNIVIVDDCIIKQVSSPSTIQRVAVDKGVNPQEVYVRVTFEYSGKEFGVSNKLRFLTKAGYEELIKAQKDKTSMKLAVDTESGFFYIEKDVSVDDLFKEAVTKTADTRANLSALLA